MSIKPFLQGSGIYTVEEADTFQDIEVIGDSQEIVFQIQQDCYIYKL